MAIHHYATSSVVGLNSKQIFLILMSLSKTGQGERSQWDYLKKNGYIICSLCKESVRRI